MIQLTRTDVEQFRTIVGRRLGLHFEDAKLDFLADVVRQRMVATKIARFEAYAAETARLAELRALAEVLTVNETFFFRNADNFRAFTETVLPDRTRAREPKRLRILSAGCASGEEPYSLAIAVRETLADFAAWEIEIVGVDINATMIAKARAARYSSWSLRATPERTIARYFRPDGRDFVLDSEVTKMVQFEERNLGENDGTLWAHRFDVVFCRNVIMYFTSDMMRQIVQQIAHVLAPGGYLFLGHAETLRGLSQQFHLRHTHDTFYYQRRDSADVYDGDAPARVNEIVSPPPIDTNMSWVDAIQQASHRIAALANTRPRASGAPAEPSVAPIASVARGSDFSIVLEAMRQERFGEALDLLAALPTDARGEPEALLLHGVLLANAGKLDAAEAVCRSLLGIDELNAGAHYVMALCREHAGDPAHAVEHDQTAVYLDASFAMPHLHLGLLARRAGDLATARSELEQALVLLEREDPSRVLLFGGGFTREALLAVCRSELRAGGER